MYNKDLLLKIENLEQLNIKSLQLIECLIELLIRKEIVSFEEIQKEISIQQSNNININISDILSEKILKIFKKYENIGNA